jgi:hypothetical protein
VAEMLAASGNTTRSIEVERLMAIKQPPISSGAQLEGLLQPTAKPEHGRIFLSRATEPKLERATRARADSKAGHVTPVHAGNRQAPAIVPVAAETVAVGAEGIGLAIAAHPPAPVQGEVQWVMARAGAAAVRRGPAVRVAAPAWVPAEAVALAVAADGGGNNSWRRKSQ